MSLKKDLKKLIKESELIGWSVMKTNNNHFKWMHPRGGLFYSSSTPSDRRAIMNIMEDIRKYQERVAKC